MAHRRSRTNSAVVALLSLALALSARAEEPESTEAAAAPVVLTAPAPQLPVALIAWGQTSETAWSVGEGVGEENVLTHVDLNSGAIQKTYSLGDAVPRAVSANGRTWFGTTTEGLVIGQVGRSTPPVVVADSTDLRHSECALSPTGRHLVILAGYGSALLVADARTGAITAQRELTARSARVLEISPDGSHVAVASSSTWLELHPMTADGEARTLGDPVSVRNDRVGSGSLAFTPDGSKILQGDRQGRVHVWSIETGERTASIDVGGSRVERIAVARRAPVAAVTTVGGLLSVIDIGRGVRCSAFAGAGNAGLFIAADGSRIAISSDGVTETFDAKTGEPLHTVPGHRGAPIAAAWRGPTTLVTVGEDARLCTWDATDGALRSTHALPNETGFQFVQPALSANGEAAAWPLADGSIVVVPTEDPESARAYAALGKDSAHDIKALAVDSGGTHVAVIGRSADVPRCFVLDLSKKGESTEVPGVAPDGFSLAISPGGRRIAYVGSGGVRIADVQSGAQVKAQGVPTGSLPGLGFSPDGTLLVVRSARFNAHVFDATTGEQVQNVGWARNPRPAKSASVELSGSQGAVFVGGNRVIAACGTLPTVRVWDGIDGRVLTDIEPQESWITGLAPSPDGRYLAVLTTSGVEIHDLATAGGNTFTSALTTAVPMNVDDRKRPLPAGATQRLYPRGKAIDDPTSNEQRMAAAVLAVRYLPDGKVIAASTADGSIRLCEVETGKIRKTLAFTGTVPFKIDVDDAGKRLAAYGLRRDAQGGPTPVLAAWDLDSGRKTWEVLPEQDLDDPFDVSSDGQHVATAESDQLLLWRVGEAAPRTVALPERVRDVTFTSDSRAVLVSARHELYLVDLATATVTNTLTVSPDDDGPSDWGAPWLATFGASELRALDRHGRSCIWDLEKGETKSVGFATIHSIEFARFSSDGSLVAAAGRDGPLVVLRFDDGAELLHIPGRRTEIDRIGFDISPDGKWLATGEMDATILLWPLDAAGR